MTITSADLEAFSAAAKAAPNVTELLLSLVTPGERQLLRRCALTRRFNEALVNEVFRVGTPGEPVSFERLIDFAGVSPESGRPGWYHLDAADRTAHEKAWRWQVVVTNEDGLTLGDERFRAWNARLADWFARTGPDGEVEEIYHRLAADLPSATTRFHELYDAASRSFDLARCESLLAVLDARKGLLDPALVGFRTDAGVQLRARSVIANDFYRTARHFERPALVTAFAEMLDDDKRFILQLYGPGGRGKTMFLRWLAARYCLERGIPIARVDFDFLDESEAGLEPRFFFGKLAEQLNLQLPTAPFTELLDTVREMRRAAASRRASGRRSAGSNRREEEEIEERFAAVLEESHRGSVVLVFDTLEDAALKHNVDLLAIVDAISAMRKRIAERAASTGRTPPRVVVILSGRYTLAEQYENVDTKYHEQVRVEEVKKFEPDEARNYLTTIRGIAPSKAVEEVIEQADGSPIRLALYADILVANPDISDIDIRNSGSVDTFYLVERVLRRIPDYALRWVLRYGVVARRLTRQFLEEVLAPHLERAMRGDHIYDDPNDDRVQDDRWRALWRDDGTAKSRKLKYDKLWVKLCEFASPSSWVTSDEGRDVLVFQPAVTHPMRRVLRTKPVYKQMQRDAVRVLRARVADAPLPSPADLAELTYHEFQIDAADAKRRWYKRLDEYAPYSDLVKGLALIIVSEDLRESEAEPNDAGGETLVTAAMEARAHFALATAYFDDARDGTLEEQQRHKADARLSLDRYTKKLGGLTERVVPLANEASLRWELADDPQARDLALTQLIEAERAGVAGDDQPYVLQTLERAFTLTDPERAQGYAQRQASLARKKGDASDYGEAVRSACDHARRRGAFAAALKECQAGIAVLRPGGRSWSEPREAREETKRLKRMRAIVQAELGLPATARSMADKPSSRTPTSLADSYGWSDDLMSKATLELQCGDVLDAARTLERVSARLDSFLRKKRAPSGSRGLVNRRIRCTRLQGHAARILMQFSQALDLFQSAMSLAAQSENHDDEVWLRLTRARVYLHYIGDCRQAEDQLVDDDGAVAQESPELRIQHALLRAGLHDKFGDRDEATRLLGLAEQLLPRAEDDPLGSHIELVMCALTLDLPDDRMRWLELLRETLSRFDAPSTRLNRLRGLRYCAPVHGVPRELAKALKDLTTLPAAAKGAIGTIAPPDRLRLSLRRVELLRVLGEADAARKELLAARQALHKYGKPFQHREVASTCDALDLEQTRILPSNWLGQFVKEYRDEPTLCGAVTLEEAERAFKRGMIDDAGRLAVVSQKQLEHDDAVRSAFDLQCSELQAEVAKRHGDKKTAKRFESSAATLRDELGIRRKRHSLKVEAAAGHVGIVRDRFIDASDGLVLRVNSPDTFGALAWADPPIQLGAETIQASGFLPSVLGELASGAVSGSGSLALIREMRASWLKLGEVIAECVFSASLREILPRRLDRSAPKRARNDTTADGLEIILECEQPPFHAVPWELVSLTRQNPTPLSSEPGVRHLWRGSMDRTMNRRLAWTHRAARALLGPLGTKETSSVPSLVQRALKLPVTGRFDAATRLALREAIRDKRPYPDRPLVLLVQASGRREVQSARGFSSSGTNLQEIYEVHGLDVERIEEPDPERLRAALRRAPTTVVHFATPVAESRAGSDLFLQFGSDVERSATAFTASHLATVLKSASQKTPAPLVIVDAPRPPSLDEALRQLVLRNVFAAQLYLFGRLPAVIATGLGNPLEQQQLSVTVADGIVTQRSPGAIVQRLRQAFGRPAGPAPSSSGSPELVLATSCAVLFAEDPDLDPQDLFTVKHA